jgi:excisionase family DNA binding protein
VTNPLNLFAPELVQAIERLVDERVKAALTELEPSNGSPWLSVADAAVYLGVSERTVGRLLERGRVRSTYVGRRRLLHRDDLDTHLRGGDA